MNGLEKLIAFLGRHFGPPRLFLLVAGWVLALGVWGTVARRWLPMEHGSHWGVPLELRAPLYAKFDSGWYLAIIEWGYGPPPPERKPSNHAFFPLYPLTARVFHDTFAIDGFHAELLVTYACLFLAMPLFLRDGIARLGEENAWRAIVFLLLFPTAFYFQAGYAESMLLLFSLLAFRDARGGKTWTAALYGALAGFTRAFALAMGPALFFAALEERRPDGQRRWGRALLLAASPVAAVFAWIYGMGWAKHETGLYFRSLEGWQRGSNPLAGAVAFFTTFAGHVRVKDWDFPLVLDYFCVLLFAAIAVYQLVRRRFTDAVWTACAVGLPVTTGLPGGIPRFFAVVYPAAFAMSEATRGSPRARAAAWAVSGALLLACAARFVNWQWVA